MPRSMTGFGRASARTGVERIEVEVRSVNGRHLGISYRAPETLAAGEVEVERLVRGAISRGSVTVTVRCTSPALEPRWQVDPARLAQYRDALRRAGRSLGIAGDVPLETLAALPGVIHDAAGPPASAPKLLARVRATIGRALGAHTAAREREGKTLAADLRARATQLVRLLDGIARRAPLALKAAHERLAARVAELVGAAGAAPPGPEVAREIALLATRVDIAEECVRVRHHLADLAATLRATGAVGRKLDFLAQELLREFNTIGSKAADALIASAVVEAKAEIDRVKEQAANLE